MFPPKRGRAVDRIAAIDKIKAQPKHHWRQSGHGRDGGEQNRSDALFGGSDNGFDARHITREFLVGVDQNNVVIHNDARQGNDSRTGHDDRKGLLHHQHPNQNANR